MVDRDEVEILNLIDAGERFLEISTQLVSDASSPAKHCGNEIGGRL
jgi:hypothetical protein